MSSSPSVLPNAVEGHLYSATFSASPAGSYVFSATGLPAWLTLSPAGVLSGTPTSSDVGPVSFDVSAADSITACDSHAYAAAFSVDPGSPVAVVPALGGAARASRSSRCRSPEPRSS